MKKILIGLSLLILVGCNKTIDINQEVVGATLTYSGYDKSYNNGYSIYEGGSVFKDGLCNVYIYENKNHIELNKEYTDKREIVKVSHKRILNEDLNISEYTDGTKFFTIIKDNDSLIMIDGYGLEYINTREDILLNNKK